MSTAEQQAERVASQLRNRITGTGEVDPEKILANPKNWRTHSEHQSEVVAGLLTEIGWVQNVVINRTTGHLIDGHLRVELARKRGEKLPAVFVELSVDEEDIVLALLDPSGELADFDSVKLDALLGGLETKDAALAALIADLESELGIGSENDDEEVETLLDQSVQLEPGKEFVVVMCDSDEEWSRLKVALDLRTVRRGGYKKGSAFDATSTNRVVRASVLLKKLVGKKSR
jgi:hypothetical protein